MLSRSKTKIGKDEFESIQIIKYVMKQLADWAENHALTVPIPSNSTGPRIVLQDGGRIIEPDVIENMVRKEKSGGKQKWVWAYMIPFMGLTKFFMLKALLVPIFMATLITKKIVLMAFFYIPAWFASLKICKKESVVHYHHKSTYADSEDYSPVGYDPTGYQFPGYAQGWGQRRSKDYYP